MAVPEERVRGKQSASRCGARSPPVAGIPLQAADEAIFPLNSEGWGVVRVFLLQNRTA